MSTTNPCLLVFEVDALSAYSLQFIFKVFLKKGGKPDSNAGDYDFSYKLPDFSTCKVGNDSVHVSQLESSSHEAVYIDPTKCAKDPYTVFVSNLDFNGTGEYCFGTFNFSRNISESTRYFQHLNTIENYRYFCFFSCATY